MIVNFVNKVYRDVKEEPKTYGISQDVIDLVEKSMIDRRTKKEMIQIPPDIRHIDDRDLIVGVKNKAWLLLDQKLNYLIKNRKAFRNESVMALAKIAGIAFDKTQIMKGEATEHIALKAHIKDDTTSSEALNQLLSIRERYITQEE